MNDVRTFIDVAEDLAAESGSEVEWRTAISRAYYGLLHQTAKSLSISTKLQLNQTESLHKRFWRDVRDLGAGKCMKLAAQGSSLHAARVKADYHLDKRVVAKDADSAVKQAKKLIELVGEVATKL